MPDDDDPLRPRLPPIAAVAAAPPRGLPSPRTCASAPNPLSATRVDALRATPPSGGITLPPQLDAWSPPRRSGRTAAAPRLPEAPPAAAEARRDAAGACSPPPMALRAGPPPPDMPFVLFVDFEAAFVSLDRGYPAHCLRRLGMPPPLLAAAASLAQLARTTLLASPPGAPVSFAVGSGIPQGCPLSGGAFSLATVPMLRALSAILGDHRVLAYADDFALIIPSVTLVPRIAVVLEALTRAAGLRLNLRKCSCVPLHSGCSGEPAGLLAAAIAEAYPALADIKVSPAADLLGTLFAPSLGEAGRWQATDAKHRKRLKQLTTSAIAPSLAVRVYGERVAPLFEYRAQFMRMSAKIWELDVRIVEGLWRLPVRGPPTCCASAAAGPWLALAKAFGRPLRSGRSWCGAAPRCPGGTLVPHTPAGARRVQRADRPGQAREVRWRLLAGHCPVRVPP